MEPNLNDRSVIQEFGSAHFLEWTESFPFQCLQASELALTWDLPSFTHPIRTLIVAGMGGSAIGGDLLRVLVEVEGAAPVVVVRGYDLPAYVGADDLVVCCSYSGDTDETLSLFRQARTTGATVAAITSGGALERLSRESGAACCIVPAGLPPRCALGYLFLPLVRIAEVAGVLPRQDVSALLGALTKVAGENRVEAVDAPAKRLARHLVGSVPVLYGIGSAGHVAAKRWRSEFNENAKTLAIASTYPELDHNELMGWVHVPPSARFAGIRLQVMPAAERLRRRAEITERLMAESVSFLEAEGCGETLLASLLSLTYLGDWVSLYLARLNAVDPMDIGRIDQLKSELSR